MELNYNFENILKPLFAKFHISTDEISLYVLAATARQYHIGLDFFDLFNPKILEEVEKSLSSETTLLELKDEIKNPDSFIQKKRIYHQNLCKFLIQDYLRSNSSFKNGYFYEPQNLTKLLIEIAEPKPKQIIFNPYCGIGSIFVELYKKFPKYDFEFIGLADYKTGFLCEMNLFANDVRVPLKIIPFNPLKEEVDVEVDDEANLAITVPPFGSRHFSIADYIVLTELALDRNGKAVIVVPEGFLINTENKKLRELYLLSADWIEKVISLPEDTFKPNTSIKTSIVVFNKNKSQKGFVIFDGKGDGFEETQVSTNIIKSQKNFDLRAFRYASKESKEVENILAHSQHPVKKIKDLVEILISGYNYSPNNRIAENSSEILPYARVSDLAKDDKDFSLDISKVEREISLEKARRNTIIDFSAVLVSKIAPKLKPTYFKFIGQPIVIGSDVIALKMKEDVNVEYFLTQLHSRLVQIQVEMMSSGATINRISKDDFLNIQIILPPLEEQQRQILEMRGVIEEKAIAQEKVARAEQQADAIEYEVIANMNHSLKNKLGVIINDYDTLVRFLQRKERTNSPVSFNDTIRPVFEGETIAEVDTIRLITERLKNNLLDTSKVFNTSLKLQTKELKTTPVELVSYFRNEIKPLYAGENFIIEFFAEPKLKLNVLLDKEVFKNAIDDLINNAKSHGFSDKDREYKIVFELSKLGEVYDEESQSVINYARIIYKDNGRGFPKGFSFNDYVQYSSKAGKTQGTGIGGAVVNRIVKLHNGKFNELSADEYSDFGVQFEILLPLDE